MNRKTAKRGAGLLAVALTLALGGAALGMSEQSPTAGTGDHRGPFLRALRRGLAGLGLTDDQKTKIRAIVASKKDARQSLRQKMRADAGALHALAGAPDPDPAAVGAAFLKVRANREAARTMAEGVLTDVKAVLTADQQAKLDAYVAAAKQMRRARMGLN